MAAGLRSAATALSRTDCRTYYSIPTGPFSCVKARRMPTASPHLGYCATNVAQKDLEQETCAAYFAGRDVIILKDNDETGIERASTSATAHYTARRRRSVSSAMPGAKDVSEWLDLDPDNAGKLEQLCFDAPLWEPSPELPPQSDAKIEKAIAGALRAQAAPAAVQAPAPTTTTVTVDDFYAYMPMHNYIFVPTRDTWPGSSINARIPPIACGGETKIKASDWLDKFKPVEQMTWIPGEPMVIKDRFFADGGFIKRDGITVFNLYREPTIKHGDADKAYPWVDHLRRVFGDDADHIIKWLAHRVQRPFEKINHALVLGGAQGIGKDTALEPVKHAIGPWNFVEVSPQHMLARFNGFLKSVILRISEARDLGEFDRFKFYDHVKGIYRGAAGRAAHRREASARVRHPERVAASSSRPTIRPMASILPEDDRRHFVAWSELSRDSFDEAYWTTLWRWYYGEGGNGHVAAYLAGLDISGFDPKAPPRKTQAFWEIVDASRSPEDGEMQTAIDRLGAPVCADHKSKS